MSRVDELLDETAEYWADWLLDAVATATQDRRFLRGDDSYDAVLSEAILGNGRKAITNAANKIIEAARQEGEAKGREAEREKLYAPEPIKHGHLSRCKALGDGPDYNCDCGGLAAIAPPTPSESQAAPQPPVGCAHPRRRRDEYRQGVNNELLYSLQTCLDCAAIIENNALAGTIVTQPPAGEAPKCVGCGTEVDLEFAPDPYQEEINDDATPVWECASCRVESMDDI